DHPTEVEPDLATAARELEQEHGAGSGEQSERDVDPERPAPARALGEPAAEQRPGDRGDGEDRAHDAHVLAPLTGGDDVGDGRLGQDDEAATAEALDGTGDDERRHAARERADDGPHHEEPDRREEQRLAPDEVTDLAV